MSVGVAFFLLIVGLVHLIFPSVSWFLSIGWKIRNAEPSDVYLAFSRIGGGFVSVIALIVIIVSIIQTGQQQAHAMDGWNKFESEMTVKNILSIKDEYNTKVQITPHEIQSFVREIHGVNAQPYSTSGSIGSFSAQNSFLITCADGYQEVLINVDNNGHFGIAGPHWLAPDYEFTSNALNVWVQTAMNN